MQTDQFCTNVEGLWPTLKCHVQQAWVDSTFGLGWYELAIAIAIFLFFLVVRRLMVKFVIGGLKRLAKRSKTEIDDQVLGSIEAPMALVPVILGIFFASEFLFNAGPGLAESGEPFLARIIQSLISIVIFWSLFNMIEPVSSAMRNVKVFLTRAMVDWLQKAFKALFVALGAGAVLEIWGIPVGPLIASLGLFGVAVALGAQDLFRNLIGGLSVLVERRFHVGDWILVEGVVEGTVEQIGFRSTVVRRFDKAPVFVPNDVLSNTAVTNFSEMTHRRIYWKIGVEYRTSVEQLRQIRDGIEAYLIENEAFADPQEVSTFVRIDSFNDSSIDIMLYCFTLTTNWGEWLKIKEELAYHIKQVVEGAGSGFAFPSQSLYVEALPGDRAEVFVPPSR
ncbi:MAG: mechanosensitive ion channel [Alphaproteobacteria bacterium]|nr:MAG: mechanosensitive ion channel [Alphaproteobacteria bacterium]